MNYVLTKKAPKEALISANGEDVLAKSRECLELGFPKEMSDSFLTRGEKRYSKSEILEAAKRGEEWPLKLGYVSCDNGVQTAESICEQVLHAAIEEGLEFADEFHENAEMYGGGYKTWIKHASKIALTLELKTIQRNTEEFLEDMNHTYESGRMDDSIIRDFFVTWLALISFNAIQNIKQ